MAKQSEYVTLMETRKRLLREGDEAAAAELMDKIEALVATGTVTDNEFIAGAYI